MEQGSSEQHFLKEGLLGRGCHSQEAQGSPQLDFLCKFEPVLFLYFL